MMKGRVQRDDRFQKLTVSLFLFSSKDHEQICEFGEIQCVHPKCGVLVQRFDLANHLQNSCDYREVVCSYCEKRIVVVDMTVNNGNCYFLGCQASTYM